MQEAHIEIPLDNTSRVLVATTPNQSATMPLSLNHIHVGCRDTIAIAVSLMVVVFTFITVGVYVQYLHDPAPSLQGGVNVTTSLSVTPGGGRAGSG